LDRGAMPAAARKKPPFPWTESRRALRYIDSQAPGIARRRHGETFRYTDSAGAPVRDRATLERIRALAIPPNWSEVWICGSENCHLQATGRDARRRKQYIYHPTFRAHREAEKFDRLADFAAELPRLRRRIHAGLALPGLPRERVLAAIAHLLDTTFARVGNAEYRRTNGSFGLTTLETRHARRIGAEVRLAFKGKSGIRHELEIRDPRVVRVLQRCQELPGQPLFQYVDETGQPAAIDSADVNGWIQEASGSAEVSAKDFRTWHGSALALDQLLRVEPPETLAAGRQAVNRVLDEVAAKLGNTRTVSRKHYVHPDLIRQFLDGELRSRVADPVPASPRGLSAAERRLASWLRASR
jgi:DNA topoisomerase-1